jgi:hypothetical protein
MAIGYWDSATARIEAGSALPMLITSYQGNINLGISGNTTMTVQSAKIGINQTSPQTALHLGANNNIRLDWGGGTDTTLEMYYDSSYRQGLNFQGNNRKLILYNYRGDGTNTELTLDNGKVGIGTTSPGYTLEVAGTAYVKSGLNVGESGNGAGSVLKFVGGSSYYNFLIAKQYNIDSGLEITPSTATGGSTFASPAVVIKYNGNVGINTTSPSAKLHVNGTFISNALWNDSSAVSYWGNYSTAYGGLTWDTGYATIFGTSGNDLRFGADGSSPKMILKTSGNVGIGTTSPITKLSLGGYNGARLSYIISTSYNFDANGITVPSSNSGNANIGGGIDLTNNTYSVGAFSPIISFSSLSSNSAYNNAYAGIWGVLGGQATDANWVKGDLVFGTAISAGIVERMRILSNGQVGIGSSSPGVKLDVNGEGRFVSNGSSRVLYLLQDATNSGNIIQFQDQTGTNVWEVVGRNNQFYIYNASLGMAFYINPSNNRIGIGNTSPGYTLDVTGNINANSNLYVGNTGINPSITFTGASVGGFTNGYVSWNNGVTVTAGMCISSPGANIELNTGYNERVVFASGAGFYVFTNNGSGTYTNRLNLDRNGNLIVSGDVTAYGSPSDISLKTNIKPLEGALEKVMRLQGVSFTWKEDTEMSKMTNLKDDIGFIAQEVQEVIPEMVRKNDNGLLSLRDKGITALLVEAIKEQQQQIDELKYLLQTINK